MACFRSLWSRLFWIATVLCPYRSDPGLASTVFPPNKPCSLRSWLHVSTMSRFEIDRSLGRDVHAESRLRGAGGCGSRYVRCGEAMPRLRGQSQSRSGHDFNPPSRPIRNASVHQFFSKLSLIKSSLSQPLCFISHYFVLCARSSSAARSRARSPQVIRRVDPAI